MKLFAVQELLSSFRFGKVFHPKNVADKKPSVPRGQTLQTQVSVPPST